MLRKKYLMIRSKTFKIKIMRERKRKEGKIQFLGNSVPDIWNEIKRKLPEVDGAPKLTKDLPRILTPEQYLGETNQSLAHQIWNSIGYYYRTNNRFLDALKIYLAEYNEMINAQQFLGCRIHKGTPLCWAFDMYMATNCPYLAKRFIMLTLCEDSIEWKGNVPPSSTGAYFRLSWFMGMSDEEIKRYIDIIWKLAEKHPLDSRSPEWILQRIDDNWKTQYPSSNELDEYNINSHYFNSLLYGLDDKSGENLERLAEYLMSNIPGCRAKRRQRTYSTDYDVTCVLEGNFFDFRSLLEKYFICECKDWNRPVDTSTILKFAEVLRSIKTNFGIIFSREGISGKADFKDAERELVKIYQRDGIVIIVLDFDDLLYISKGGSFISVLREKYAKVRLDIK